jgi:hypothetical protein
VFVLVEPRLKQIYNDSFLCRGREWQPGGTRLSGQIPILELQENHGILTWPLQGALQLEKTAVGLEFAVRKEGGCGGNWGKCRVEKCSLQSLSQVYTGCASLPN